MDIGITSIQRDRGPWILEWLAFHMLVGFNKFYIYSHKCSDGMTDVLHRLSQHYPIVVHELSFDDRPQLAAYQHSIDNYLPTVDWMAFIDGDEFLFPTSNKTMSEALLAFEALNLSALAVYWKCYGSNGHFTDPGGLLLENFPRHSRDDFLNNRHVKSILRGRHKAQIQGSHLFQTELGTYDEQLRPVNSGWMLNLEPSYDVFRINHYVVQSYEFFKNTKQRMGQADLSVSHVRSDDFFFGHDRNECDDGVVYNYLIPVKLKMLEFKNILSA